MKEYIMGIKKKIIPRNRPDKKTVSKEITTQIDN